jgi:hypothetical protein
MVLTIQAPPKTSSTEKRARKPAEKDRQQMAMSIANVSYTKISSKGKAGKPKVIPAVFIDAAGVLHCSVEAVAGKLKTTGEAIENTEVRFTATDPQWVVDASGKVTEINVGIRRMDEPRGEHKIRYSATSPTNPLSFSLKNKLGLCDAWASIKPGTKRLTGYDYIGLSCRLSNDELPQGFVVRIRPNAVFSGSDGKLVPEPVMTHGVGGAFKV